MRKVAIIGIGHVGSTTAYTLISKQLVDEIVLFDTNTKLIQAELNDLVDGQMEQAHQVKLIAPALTELATTDVLIFSAGNISILNGNSDRFAELDLTKTIVEEWAPKIKASGFKGIIINITNPCDVITRYLQELTGLPKESVFGTGTSLDTARMKHAVSEKLRIHPTSVNGYVLGEHGESQFVAWSTVTMGGLPIADSLTSEQLIELDAAARKGGWTTFSGKGYTSYGIAVQASRIVEAILNDNQLIVPVSHYQPLEQCYASTPAKISARGISELLPLNLTPVEKNKWQLTIQTIKTMYETI